jgi:hypothetical protein
MPVVRIGTTLTAMLQQPVQHKARVDVANGRRQRISDRFECMWAIVVMISAVRGSPGHA